MTVEYQTVADGVLQITLNRPERLNALDSTGKLELAAAWEYAEQNADIRAVLIRGAGERAFCAGSDLKEIAATGRTVSTEVLARALPGVSRPFNKPVVAALHGHTLGLGISLAIHCDFRIAHPDTRFCFPEVGHGQLSGFSAITLPSLIGEAAALDIMLSARSFNATEALRIGLINSIAENPREEALQLAIRLADKRAEKAVQWSKALLLADRHERLQRHLALVNQARIDVMKPTP